MWYSFISDAGERKWVGYFILTTVRYVSGNVTHLPNEFLLSPYFLTTPSLAEVRMCSYNNTFPAFLKAT